MDIVIVDDELNAIENTLIEIEKLNIDINVVATFTKPEEAIIYLNENQIDCLFLDIEMPTMDGFQLLQQLEYPKFDVVITTAYSQYAIKAFKHNAIDYLLKPIDKEELQVTLTKINEKHQNKNQQNIEDVLTTLNHILKEPKIIIKSDGKLHFLKSEEIFYVHSDGNYCNIYLSNGSKLFITKKLKEIALLFPEKVFYRLHNSYLVNLQKIKNYVINDNYIILENNVKIPVSRQKKDILINKI